MTEAVTWRCSVKKEFLKISQNSQEKTCVRVSFLIKLQNSGLRPATLLKDSGTGVFLWILRNFLRTFFFMKTFWWLLLKSATQNGKVSSKLKIDSNMKEQLEVINIRLLNGVFSKTSVQNDFLVCITENFDVSKHLRSLDW